MTSEKALKRIKRADTIYVGCMSDIYTKYPFEIKAIEQDINQLNEIKKAYNEWLLGKITDMKFCEKMFKIFKGEEQETTENG